MIANLKINNFQSHKDTEIDFDPGVNVICGKSDSGKSAIIRAIRWVIQNRPLGNSIMTTNSRNCSVELKIINSNKSHRVIHSRTKSSLEYTINGNKITHTGLEVPEEVKDIFNILPENFQYQLDSPFLVMESDGNIASIMNEVTHLEKANILAKELERKRKEYKDKLSDSNIKEKEIQKELSKDIFTKITTSKELIARIENLENTKNKLDSEEKNIHELIHNIAFLEAKLSEFTYLDEYKNKVNSMFSLLEDIGKLQTSIDEIQSITNQLNICDNESIKSFVSKHDNLISLGNKIADIEIQIISLSNLIDNINDLHKKIQEELDKESKINKELTIIINQLSKCPTCDTTLFTRSQKQHMVECYTNG